MMSVPWTLLPIFCWIPREETPTLGSPNRAPTERERGAPCPEPSIYLLKCPVHWLTHPPKFPYGERHPLPELSSTCSLVFHLSLKVPGKWAPLHVTQQGPYGDRYSVSKANSLFIHLYQSESPVKEPSHKKGKIFCRRPRSPTRTEGLHTIGCGLVPQGDRLRYSYHCRSAMQPSARYLPHWLGYTRASLARECRDNSFTCHRLPRDQVGVWIHITLRYGRGFGFMGDSTILYYTVLYFNIIYFFQK